MGKMFQNASSLKPLGQLKPNCPGMIIGRFCDRYRYIDNYLSLLVDSVTDVDIQTIVNVSTSVTESSNRLRQLSIYLHLSQKLPTDLDNCQYIYVTDVDILTIV
jgi:hypothetical protein